MDHQFRNQYREMVRKKHSENKGGDSLILCKDISDVSKNVIQSASDTIFGIKNRRDFQYAGAHHLMFNDDTVLAVPRSTSDGKTLVVHLAHYFRGGVAVYLDPLLGLAADQVDRATITEHNLEGYHVDEHKRDDERLLMERLSAYNSDGEEARHVGISLFIGPKSLKKKDGREY